MSYIDGFVIPVPNALQSGVAPGTIDPARAVVLPGRVLTPDGASLPGVVITIRDHPELGETRTRADGILDMAANGGGRLTVSCSGDLLLPVQRQVATPWADYATPWAPTP